MTMHVIKARHGSFLCLDNDLYVGRSLIEYGEYSEGEWALLRQLVKPGDTVVEAGANIGAFTVPLARAAGHEGRVFAFEPQRLMFQMLGGNLALNEIENVYSFCMALGEERGQVHIPIVHYGEDGNFGGVGLEDEGEAVSIGTVDMLNLSRLDLLKADVEGFEERVLRGAEATIQRHRPLLYLENDRRDLSSALLSRVAGLGYQAAWHMPFLFNPENHSGNAENIFGEIASINILCFPKERPWPEVQGVTLYLSQNIDEWPLT
jgi:FkbM family methyltransferase